MWINPEFTADFLEEHRRVLESRLQPVIREITDSRARTREELESLYRKIVSAVLLRSGLGSPTDIAVVREATGMSRSLCCEIRTCFYIRKFYCQEFTKLFLKQSGLLLEFGIVIVSEKSAYLISSPVIEAFYIFILCFNKTFINFEF